MSAKARTTKARPAAKAKKKATREVARKLPAKKAGATAPKGARKEPAGKKTVKQAAVKPAAKKPVLTAEDRKARAAQRAADKRFLKESEQRLQDQRANLISAYHSAKGNTKASGAGGTEDYIDYAVSSYDRDFSLSLTELERHQLFLVEDALARIRRGEYGRCLNCGVEIPRRRLEVEAWARYCIPCQELDDQGLLDEPSFDAETEEEAPVEDESDDADSEVLAEEDVDDDVEIEEEDDV